MTSPQTHMYRDHRKLWKAETRIKLGDCWQLDISTRKSENGELVTSASIGKLERGFVTHRVFTDYSRRVFRKTARCTEKNIETQHKEALALIDQIMADVRAHYDVIGETIPDPEQPIAA
jgi:hypothetical protein